MKKLLPLLLILIFTGFAFSTFAQTGGMDEKALKTKIKTFERSKYYIAAYNKFDDKTLVINTFLLNGVGSYMWSGTIIGLSVSFEFPGKVLTKSVDDFQLTFSASGKDWKFQRDQGAIFLADDERINLGTGDLESDVNRRTFGGYQTQETIVFKINRSDLQKLANAKTVEVKVSNRAFTVKKDYLDGFKNMLDLGTIK